jgi:hypothetical protein
VVLAGKAGFQCQRVLKKRKKKRGGVKKKQRKQAVNIFGGKNKTYASVCVLPQRAMSMNNPDPRQREYVRVIEH